ncbi:hypothetical protein FRC14_008149 [Serendipita sp. 396]|nr:hypothetical protein FRC14_008149 [Serendipita sp. 396]KAG8776297.1 hypothetical protein FRC15_012008 [Serendipita sp. 397]KAG8792736.1 hypothetical protein FRC16_011279 [Serendipita sp. 398]KAG8817098.1 hypothetical protein FRC18_000687 [Serendipita sp. 400]KAG8821430.1 hypothetical protein FRC19_007804 [Serendipita sp. 401]KAG8842317.1 hypothetical protein FRB91_004267 [Serendipita sp. 411]KAG9053290.1 hypothetical protein FS842_008391 [Serendipita sp. 407]
MADDPRNASLETKLTRPRSWEDTTDFISAISMFFAGITMLSRNRQFAWPAVAIALSGWVNSHPLRTKEGGQGVGPLLFSLGSLATVYLPLMVLPPTPLQTPLST